ncbi:MAG TPA: anaerobic sulfatase maturase [Bryobacteraceae bacterium]|jgi:uncharacterized protein|nr:anaerobic sulfatase maturase [Bryobacteraceae bacterium]
MKGAAAENPFRIVQSLEVDRGDPLPKIGSLLIKPASALCNLDCTYCFYLDRTADPYETSRTRIMSRETLQRLVEGYLAYSFPQSSFAFQGGEPTLAGLDFFQSLIEFQKRFGRRGQFVSNSIQTNGTLLTREWCELFRSYHFLVGISLDGPEDVHDAYRLNKAGHGTWKAVMDAVALLQREQVEFNILAVVSQANVRRALEMYRFFRGLGLEYFQFIPLVEFRPDGQPEPFAISGEEYGQFLCDLFQAWWPERRTVRIRYFDNIAEALAGQKPSTCTMHQSCDSYAVVEHNGDVYPCDFFVERSWNLGNIHADNWQEIARRAGRRQFASKKIVPHAECSRCEFYSICQGGCPSNRHARRSQFEDLDPLCAGYKMIFSKSVGPLTRDLRSLGVL